MKHSATFMSLIKSAALAVVTVLGVNSAIAADTEFIPFGQEKFKISAGGFFSGFNSSLKIDAKATEGNRVIDVEDDLGLDSSNTTFRAGVTWRFLPRHRLQIEYYSLDRSGTKELTTEIEWEDEVFPVGVTIDSGLGFDVIPISYAWSFVKRDRVEIAATLGVHWLDIDSFISGMAFVGDETITVQVTDSTAYNGPFPLIGVRLDFEPGRRWQLGTSIQYLDVSISSYRGSIVDLRAYVEYSIWRNFGIGLSYNFFDIDVTVERQDFVADFDVNFNGFLAYVNLEF